MSDEKATWDERREMFRYVADLLRDGPEYESLRRLGFDKVAEKIAKKYESDA